MTSYRQNYGIGLVGLGIGQQHLRGYRCQDLNVVAICDLDQSLLATTAEEFGIGASHYDTCDALSEALSDLLGPQVNVLVKGSRGARMERVVEALIEEA